MSVVSEMRPLYAVRYLEVLHQFGAISWQVGEVDSTSGLEVERIWATFDQSERLHIVVEETGGFVRELTYAGAHTAVIEWGDEVLREQ